MGIIYHEWVVVGFGYLEDGGGMGWGWLVWGSRYFCGLGGVERRRFVEDDWLLERR